MARTAGERRETDDSRVRSQATESSSTEPQLWDRSRTPHPEGTPVAMLKTDLQSYPQSKPVFSQAHNPPKGVGETISQHDRSAMETILTLTMFLGAVTGCHLRGHLLLKTKPV